jgi:hypothetical protein
MHKGFKKATMLNQNQIKFFLITLPLHFYDTKNTLFWEKFRSDWLI